jgi:hypothetical protein
MISEVPKWLTALRCSIGPLHFEHRIIVLTPLPHKVAELPGMECNSLLSHLLSHVKNGRARARKGRHSSRATGQGGVEEELQRHVAEKNEFRGHGTEKSMSPEFDDNRSGIRY